MLRVRRSGERGHAVHDWLDSFHSFSFASYYDPHHMGFRSLRVINEDRIAGGGGFPPHGHRDMEIITYVIAGALEHKDSLGNGSIIQPGDVQYMSAGTGVVHSEFNHSQTQPVHLLQIWIETNQLDAEPQYDQRHFSRKDKMNQLCLIAGSEEGALPIRQTAKVFACVLEANNKLEYSIPDKAGVWLQLISGKLTVNDKQLEPGDAISTTTESTLKIAALEEAEFLVFALN